MITKSEIVRLQGLTNSTPRAFKSGDGAKVFLYTSWFVLELFANELDPQFADWTDVIEVVAAWKEKIPAGEGAFGQATRWTNPDDNVALIKLISDVGVVLVHPSIYEIVTKQLPGAEFRVFEGNKECVAVFRDGAALGGVAQVTV